MKIASIFTKLLVAVLVIVIVIEGVVVFFFDGFAPRSCPQSFDKKSLGCFTKSGYSYLESLDLVLLYDKTERSSNEAFIVLRYPLFSVFSIPIRFRAGAFFKDKISKIALCKVEGKFFSSAHDCRIVPANTKETGLKNGSVVVARFFTNLPKGLYDPYTNKCIDTHNAFLKTVEEKKGLGSLKQFLFPTSICSPIVGQLFYQ